MKTVGNYNYSAHVVGQHNMLFYSILAEQLKIDLHKGINNLYFQDYIAIAKHKTMQLIKKDIEIAHKLSVAKSPKGKNRYVLAQVLCIHEALQYHKPAKYLPMPLWVYGELITKTGLDKQQLKATIQRIKLGKYNDLLHFKYGN